jgi:vacuolar-type H+-ATPase subunit C/Vma6
VTSWGDVLARARGLATHLLQRRELDALVRSSDLATLGDGLRRANFPVAEGERSPAALELAVRRRAARALGVLARWAGRRAATLAIVFEDEDRRSLRALVRGAVQHAPAEIRLSGLVPTPTCSERLLAELSLQATAGAVATLLSAWGNPYGPPLRPLAVVAYPDLLRLDATINRTFAARALAGAASEAELLALVRESIDVENVLTAMAIAGTPPPDVVPKALFLPGGRRVTIDVFETAVAGGAGRAAERLAAALAGSGYARAVAGPPALLEDELLRARIAALRHDARLRPLGPAPLLYFALRLRAESIDLGRTIWGLALGAPPAALADALLAPV